MSLDLTYRVGQPQVIPLSAHLQNKLVVSGHNVFLTTLQQELHQESFDPVKSELDNAYHVTCSIAAEYQCMEEAAANMAAMTDICSDSQTSVFVPALAKLNASAAIDWLRQNYEEQDSISLPRGALYSHYLDFCQESNLEPMNQASLGKVIRSIFPDVKTRRLGTRGQSKYHYYGMGIRDSSPYKDVMQHAQRISGLCSSISCRNVSGGMLHNLSGSSATQPQLSVHHMSQSPTYSMPVPKGDPSMSQTGLGGSTSGRSWTQSSDGSSPAGIMLPDFPTIGRICISADIQDKVAVLLMMYKHHCQRVITTILRSSFSEVCDQLVQFWKCLPPRMTCILSDSQVISLVALCDVQLYKAVVTLLVPTVLQPLPNSMMSSVHSLADDLVAWLSMCHGILPEALRLKKLQVARSFTQCLKRRAGISHMATVARAFLHSSDMVLKLHHDWRLLDVTAVAHECCTLVDDDGTEQHRQHCRIRKCLHEFEKLLYQHSTIDHYLAWVHSLVNSCVFQVAHEKKLVLPPVARHFLLTWTFVLKVIMKDLTLVSADMVGSYHLLGMMFTDYIMYLIEQNERSRMIDHLAHTIYRGLAPDWTEEDNYDEASIGGSHFVNDTVLTPRSTPSEPLYTCLNNSESCDSDIAADTPCGQFSFDRSSLGKYSAVRDTETNNTSELDCVTFDATPPMSRSSNNTWCSDERRSSQGNTRDERRHHTGFLDDPLMNDPYVAATPLMNDPCVAATPPGSRPHPRQVTLTFSASESFSTDNSCSNNDNPDWYLADVASSSEALCRRYGSGTVGTGSNDSWYGGGAANYSVKSSDGGSTYDNGTGQWHPVPHGNHDPGCGYHGNAAWYYSEQTSNFKLPQATATVKNFKQQQARCVDMSVANGNPAFGNPVIANDTVAPENHTGRMYVGGQRDQSPYRMHERAGSRCYQRQRPCTTSSGAAMWMSTTSPCSQRLVVQQSDTLVTHSH